MTQEETVRLMHLIAGPIKEAIEKATMPLKRHIEALEAHLDEHHEGRRRDCPVCAVREVAAIHKSMGFKPRVPGWRRELTPHREASER